MPTEPPDASINHPSINPTHPVDAVATTPNPGNKRRISTTTGSRGVTSLTPEQLTKKRANDREAQRAIRERTKNQIETLERRVQELTSQQPYQELQAAIRQKEVIQAENDEIRRRLSSALAILEPMLSSQGANGKDYFYLQLCFTKMVYIDIQIGPMSIGQHNAHISQPGPDHITASPMHRFGYCQAHGASVSPAVSSITVPSTPQSVMTPADQPWHGSNASATNNYTPWSPVNAFHQQRDSLAHGLELGTSGEKLGFGFLVDKGQNIARLSNGSSARGTSADGSTVMSGTSPVAYCR